MPPLVIFNIPPILFSERLASLTSMLKAENTELFGEPPKVILLEPEVTFNLVTTPSAPMFAGVKVLVVQLVGCP